MMKETSEKLAAKLAKEHPELGIKPHTNLYRVPPKDPSQVKWHCGAHKVWSSHSMAKCVTNAIKLVTHDDSIEVTLA